ISHDIIQIKNIIKNKIRETLGSIINNYIDNSKYVYKMCQQCYLIIMEKTKDTITNESRLNINDNNNFECAKFRASELKVILIIDCNNNENRPKSLTNIYVH